MTRRGEGTKLLKTFVRANCRDHDEEELMDPSCIADEDQPPSKRSKFEEEAFDGPPALAPDLPPVSVSGMDCDMNPMMEEAMPHAGAAVEAAHAHGDDPVARAQGGAGTSDGPVIQPEPKILPGAYTQREEASTMSLPKPMQPPLCPAVFL